MSARKGTYLVFPLDNLWMVSCEDELEAWGPYPSKTKALRVAKAVAKLNAPSEVCLQGLNGRLEVAGRFESAPDG